MRVLDAERLSLDVVDKLFDFWKSFQRINENLPKNYKGLILIGVWIKSCVEFKVKTASLDSLKKEFKRKKERLEGFLSKVQENASKILRLSEEKEFIKKALENTEDEKNLKEMQKFIRNKEKNEIQSLEQQKSQKNLKFLLKEMKSSEKLKEKEEEPLQKEDSASIINVSEELFNLAYKSPNNQDLRHKFLINCPKNIQFNKKESNSWRGDQFNLKEKLLSLNGQKKKLSLEKSDFDQKKNSGFLTDRSQKKEFGSFLMKEERKSSLTILRKPKEEEEIDEYELNLKGNNEKNNYQKEKINGDGNSNNGRTRLCESNCCRSSFGKWC